MKKILLLCAAGMSTSMVVKKMKESAVSKGLDVHIEAHGVETISDYLTEYDIFLLGPQIRFKKDELQRLADPIGKKVEVIDMLDYGMLKGEKILDDALALLNQ
ncbi:PTS sugar transporter subunit IIB [Photobacterium sp. DNB23_23_1]|uniref:PTS sugar transporter subunit IIB n=1 Tax=Photobacterium pectinilyticum TaxID=2906793 RepID=A0ABT1N6U3_9GAMM|nr:PTS sugar transporter subunit IIB [Photobacterium sp. ZSDE20]MCQ1060473.1 PTS sugar transporter subunit IIB [Photobacterium sp. ZSDE20]MDD1827873.1 PTS sugar transporter subunit IIB [Photobacterium sp. ZSDE20]